MRTFPNLLLLLTLLLISPFLCTAPWIYAPRVAVKIYALNFVLAEDV